MQSAFIRLQPGWFLLAFAVMGLAVLSGGWRCHQVFRVTSTQVHLGASLRIFAVAVALGLALFGVAGAEVVKTGIYARWYRRSLAGVVAAAPLDRMIGMAGALVLGAITLLIGASHGAFDHLKSLGFRAPGPTVVVLLVAGLVAGVVFLRWRVPARLALGGWRVPGWDFVARTLGAVQAGVRQLLTRPGIAAAGLIGGMGVQLGAALSMALCLRAVAAEDLPWLRMAWTFPVITVISALPSVGGAGLREIASTKLLGFYGVDPADAVAASLLTLLINLLWGGVGAILLWREERRFSRHAARVDPQSLSVVIPTFNEAAKLPATLASLRALPEVKEIIVVDGGSTDATREVAGAAGATVLTAPGGRGGQLRAGAAAATGDVVWLVHADTVIPAGAGGAVLDALRDRHAVGGGCWKVFDEPSLLMRGSRFKCGLRWFLGRRVLGDQTQFVRRDVLASVGGVPDQPLFEDYELSRRLRRVGRLVLADAVVVTSARRFRQFGALRLYWRMWRLTWRYRRGASPADLRRAYDAG